MPSVSEWTREGEDREADVHQPHHCDGTANASGTAGLWQEIQALTKERDGLLSVIRDVHSQHADDLCWMDIDRIFTAAGLPVPDRRVGDKVAMLQNCQRFIDGMCQGGSWQSYRELEARIADLESRYEIAQDERDSALNRNCELTEKLDLLESQLATERTLKADWQQIATDLRASLTRALDSATPAVG